MKMQRVGIALTVVNGLLLAVGLTQSARPALASDIPAMLRGRGLEIVDEQGRVRASITVFPAKTEAPTVRPPSGAQSSRPVRAKSSAAA